MYLEEVLEPSFGLQQDNWSLQCNNFGKEGQLTVIGWSGYGGTGKWYILTCSTCGMDSELHGNGHFRMKKGDLLKGAIPCACTRKPTWSAKQYEILCQRAAESKPFRYLGLAEDFRNSLTYIKLECQTHGIWETANITRLIHDATGCPKCGIETVSEFKSKEDHDFINSFFAVGTFHPDTIFQKIDRQDVTGRRPYWLMHCPDCNSSGEATSSALRLGSRPCECSPQRQKQAYINFVYDGNDVVALKFGVANNFYRRLKEQRVYSSFKLENFGVWEFKTKLDCFSAERLCKETLLCPVLSKQELPDGWSETTPTYNVDKIISLYESCGGIRIK